MMKIRGLVPHTLVSGANAEAGACPDNIRIGLNIIEQDGGYVSPSHYYCFSYMTDVSVGMETAEDEILIGAEGGAFTLVPKVSEDQEGISRYLEGFVGIWTGKDGKSCAVQLEEVGHSLRDVAAAARSASGLTQYSDPLFDAAWINTVCESVQHEMSATDGYAYRGRGLVFFESPPARDE